MILNLFVLLMSFFSCDWILLTFLIRRLQAEWRRRLHRPCRLPPGRLNSASIDRSPTSACAALPADSTHTYAQTYDALA
jgi:hypothetical protein